MQDNQLISLIVPVYNVEKYMDKCIESIVNQTYKNLEIILVDDGATDGSGEKCDAWGKKDDRIKVIHKENGGLGNARNVGMKYAQGEWIGFVDSDDFISPSMYETLYNICNEFCADLAVTSFSFYYNGKTSPIHSPTGDIVLYEGNEWIDEYYGKEKSGNIVPAAWSKLYKRELIIDKKFSEGRYYEDIVVTAMVLNEAKKIVYINEPLYFYRKDRTDSITESMIDVKRIDDSLDLRLEEISYLRSVDYLNTADELLQQLYFDLVNQIGIYSIKKLCGRDALEHMKYREKEIYQVVRKRKMNKKIVYVFAHYMKRSYALIKKLQRMI